MPSIPVVCALILHEGKVMLAQRPEGKHLALKWEFPGGKVELDELPEHAMVRELREELGCEVRLVAALKRSSHEYDRGTVEMIPFICELSPGSAFPHPHEHAALIWVQPMDLAQHDLAPADYPVVDAFAGWLAEKNTSQGSNLG
jgi:8-oxo-dGTP diphosphatase